MHRKSTQQKQLAPRGFFGRIAHAFRERQIYVRSRGEVQFVTVKPYVLVIGLFVVLTSFFWLAFASINVSFKDELIAVKERNLYQSKIDNEERVAELRKKIDQLNAKLLLDQKGYLQEVDKVHREYKKLEERHNKLSGFFRQGWFPVKPVTPSAPNQYSGPTSAPKNGKSNFNKIEKQSHILNRDGKSSFNELTYVQKYARAFADRKEALEPIQDLRREMANFNLLEGKLLREVALYARKKSQRMSKIYRRLGINPKGILKTTKLKTEDNVGGPFIAVTTQQIGSPMVAERLRAAIYELNNVKILQQGAKRLPLAKPVKNIIRITSPFGIRRDPMRRIASMHTGIDIKAPYRSKVRSPAAGLVIFASWGGGYGRLVKVRHANGIETRYAHMNKILVKKGQYIKAGQAVGLLGNSGRSTGFHLHYETRVNNRVFNPARFWKARNDFQSFSQKK